MDLENSPPSPGKQHSEACAVQMKETPLIRAAHNGHLLMVQFLVGHGADVDGLDLVNMSSWHMTQEMLRV